MRGRLPQTDAWRRALSPFCGRRHRATGRSQVRPSQSHRASRSRKSRPWNLLKVDLHRIPQTATNSGRHAPKGQRPDPVRRKLAYSRRGPGSPPRLGGMIDEAVTISAQGADEDGVDFGGALGGSRALRRTDGEARGRPACAARTCRRRGRRRRLDDRLRGRRAAPGQREGNDHSEAGPRADHVEDHRRSREAFSASTRPRSACPMSAAPQEPAAARAVRPGSARRLAASER